MCLNVPFLIKQNLFLAYFAVVFSNVTLAAVDFIQSCRHDHKEIYFEGVPMWKQASCKLETSYGT